jgi:multidrug resistance efflux pump
MDVMYREGDVVRKGDLPVEVDPRPYEVKLDQIIPA